MQRKLPDAIRNMSNFVDMRASGIELAAKKVFEKDYEEAKKLFTRVLEISPNDVHVLCLLANVFILEGNFKKAEEWLDKALRTNPNYPWASYHMGVVYHELGEFEKSIEMYEKALEHFSKNDKDEIADTYQNLGCSLWEIKEYLAGKDKEDFDDIKEANVVLQKSMKAWNDKILPKWGAKLDRMKTKDKVKLFKETKCD